MYKCTSVKSVKVNTITRFDLVSRITTNPPDKNVSMAIVDISCEKLRTSVSFSEKEGEEAK